MIEPIWDQLNEAWDSGPEEFLRRFTSIRSGARHLYAAHWCISEVENGGLLQFFWNGTGILAPEARESFAVVGLSGLAGVLEDAMNYFLGRLILGSETSGWHHCQIGRKAREAHGIHSTNSISDSTITQASGRLLQMRLRSVLGMNQLANKPFQRTRSKQRASERWR